MKRLASVVVSAVVAAFFALAAVAAENSAAGTWKWSFTTQNGDTIDSILKLKQEGEKITGSLTNRFGEAQITDGSVKDNQVSFKVKREFNGQEFIVKYSGKLAADKITGKSEFERDGETRSREWEAKRDTGKSVAGAWNTALILPDGNRIEGSLKLKQEGEKVTGTLTRNENETHLKDGKVAGEEISFTILREREGRTVTAKYKGKLSGDTIKGKVESDWSGDWQTLDWEGSRAK